MVNHIRFLAIIVLALYLTHPSIIWADNYTTQLKKPVKESISVRQTTQKNQEQWNNKKETLRRRLEKLQEEHHDLISKNRDLKARVNFNQERVHLLQDNIRKTAQTTREIRPYLKTVYSKLKLLIESSQPFLKKEREKRIARLSLLLENPEVSTSEKYRKVMEALFVEAEYGNSIEVYAERILLKDKEITASILRIGRISLFFQTPDKSVTGQFDPFHQKWSIFPNRFNRDINNAFEIAAKRRPAKLVNLPLGKLAKK